jgi:hypothetical protein
MGCCGEGRARLRASGQTATSSPEPPVAAPPAHEPDSHTGDDLEVEYRGTEPILLRVAASGRAYTFSLARRVRKVPALDAERLASSPLFRLAQRDDEGSSNGTATKGLDRQRRHASSGSH